MLLHTRQVYGLAAFSLISAFACSSALSSRLYTSAVSVRRVEALQIVQYAVAFV